MSNRIKAAFIDGSNIYESAKTLGFDIDYKRLLDTLQADGDLLQCMYFTALPPKEVESPLRTTVDWMEYNGYTVIQKEMREYVDTTTGRVKKKGNMDIEIAVHALSLSDRITDAILFSGDGDFRILVEELQRRGVYVTVVSSLHVPGGKQPLISDSLRRQANKFVCLSEMKESICKTERRGNHTVVRRLGHD